MEVIIKETYEEVSREAAEMVRGELKKKPGMVLGLATGSTPLGLYKELIRMHKEEGLDFSQVVTFNLDEYVGLQPDHPQSYRYFMNENLFDHINIKMENTHVPDGMAEDLEAHCGKYEEMIKKAGGIDLQVLGIGGDGHIAFNEPCSSLGSRTRIKTLTKQTIEDNSRFFEKKEDVPIFAITMGVGSVMESREVLLLASGEKKAEVIARCIEGPITAQVTASMVQMHPWVTVIVDTPASMKLKRRDYYEWVYESKKKLRRKTVSRES